MTLAWTQHCNAAQFHKNKIRLGMYGKTIDLCTCGKGKKIKGESQYSLIDYGPDGFCRYCGYALSYRRVPSDWTASTGGV